MAPGTGPESRSGGAAAGSCTDFVAVSCAVQVWSGELYRMNLEDGSPVNGCCVNLHVLAHLSTEGAMSTRNVCAMSQTMLAMSTRNVCAGSDNCMLADPLGLSFWVLVGELNDQHSGRGHPHCLDAANPKQKNLIPRPDEGVVCGVQACKYCVSETYSLSPLDKCVEGVCRLRECELPPHPTTGPASDHILLGPVEVPVLWRGG
eukprot:608248-Rhodomonas_salina.1